MPIASYAYTVGPAGNRLAANESVHTNGIRHTINRIYTYDNLYRLVGEDISVGWTSSPASLNYFYDPVGNRLARQSTLPALLPQSFSHDPNDRLNTDTYDANGNTLFGSVPASGAGFGTPPTTLGCAYDFENRLIRATTADGKTVTIVYDGDGHRVKKTVVTATNTVTIFYVVDDQNPTGYAQVLEEHVSLDSGPSTLDCVYTYGLMLISQRRAIGTSGPNVRWVASFHGYDGHNNVRYLTDTAGNITDTFDYDAFGNLISRTGNTPNNYLYCGEQLDPDLGLYFLRARYLNPDTGRFWTMDLYEGFLDDPRSLHKYTYAHNNPVNFDDPLGLITLGEVIGTLRNIGILAARVVYGIGRIILTVSRTALNLLSRGYAIRTRSGTILVRALKLRTGGFRPSYELLKIRNIIRIEAHPLIKTWPDWLFYPHWHIDFLGKAISRLHICPIETAVAAYALWKLWGESDNGGNGSE
jgi:RHS repeat-associated protein